MEKEEGLQQLQLVSLQLHVLEVLEVLQLLWELLTQMGELLGGLFRPGPLAGRVAALALGAGAGGTAERCAAADCCFFG